MQGGSHFLKSFTQCVISHMKYRDDEIKRLRACLQTVADAPSDTLWAHCFKCKAFEPIIEGQTEWHRCDCHEQNDGRESDCCPECLKSELGNTR